MANADIREFHFYFGYLWDQNETGDTGDFYSFQQWMRDRSEGSFEGLAGASVLEGLQVVVKTAMTVTVKAGVALTAAGRLMVLASDTDLVLTAPGSNTKRTLIVLRPSTTDMTAITQLIPSPPNPAGPYYLHKKLVSTPTIIDGTSSATPVYPAINANDVILSGVRLVSGETSVVSTDFDPGVRDVGGKNSILGNTIGLRDDRLRPYLQSVSTLAIKPSRTLVFTGNGGTFQLSSTHRDGGHPSRFPRTSGSFSAADATVNLTTGIIGGGDADSGSYSPSLPTAGNYRWLLFSIKPDDKLIVYFGTIGTYTQCKAALTGLVFTGAGALPGFFAKPVALVLIGSSSGSAVTDSELYDVRGLPYQGAKASADSTFGAGNHFPVRSGVRLVEVDCTGGDVFVDLPLLTDAGQEPVDVMRIDQNDSASCWVGTPDLFNYDTSSAYETNDRYQMPTRLQSAVFVPGISAWNIRR